MKIAACSNVPRRAMITAKLPAVRLQQVMILGIYEESRFIQYALMDFNRSASRFQSGYGGYVADGFFVEFNHDFGVKWQIEVDA